MKYLKFWTLFPFVFIIFIDNLNFSGSYPLITGMFKVHADILFPDVADMKFIDLCMGFAYLAFPLGMLFSTAIIEDVSHMFGKKKTLLFALFGIAVGFSLMALAIIMVNIWLFLVGRLFTGMMSGIQPIAAGAIGDIAEEKHTHIRQGLLTFSIMLGVVIGPLIGGVFADHDLFIEFSYSLPFFITAFLSLLAMFFLSVSMRKDDSAKKVPFEFRSLRKEWLKLRFDPRLRLLFCVFALFQFGFATYYQFMLVKLSLEFNYLIIELGLFAALIGIGFMASSVTILPKISRAPPSPLLSAILLALTGFIMLFSAYTHLINFIWIFAFFIAFVDLLAYASLLPHFSSNLLKQGQKVALGIAMFAVILGWLFSSLLANLILEIDIDHVLAVGGIAILMSAVFMIYYAYRYRISRNGI